MDEVKEEKLPEKKDIAMLVIEKQWYLNLINFLGKAFNISDEEMQRYLNGTKPDFKKEDVDKLIADLEKVFAPHELPKQPAVPKPLEKKEDK